LDVLTDAVDFSYDSGGISGTIFAFFTQGRDCALPDNSTGLFVESYERGVCAARRADESLTIDQHRLAELPAAHHLSAEITRQVLSPMLPAGSSFETNHITIRTKYVKKLAIDRGC